MNIISVIGGSLCQWDIGRKIQVRFECDEVHVACVKDTEALVVVPYEENGQMVADIPNILLQSGRNIAVYCVKDNITLCSKVFGVKDRAYVRVEPRAAICFKPLEIWSLKASYTEMNQFAHRLTTTFIDLPSAVWMPSTADIEPMLSRQVALGTNVALPHNISIEVEGFYKTMEHIREYKGYRLFPPIQNWEHTYVEGRGRAYGMEASVVYNTVKTHAAVNYTLSWSERLFEDIFPTWFPDRLDNRHRLNLSVSHRFTDRFEMYLGWNWHSGDRITTESQSSPSTGLHYYTGPNNATLPDYHRLDVGFNFHKTTRRGNEAIWNLSIYNVYCRMNAMVVWDLRDRYEAVGLVPILPTFSYTLKFRK